MIDECRRALSGRQNQRPAQSRRLGASRSASVYRYDGSFANNEGLSERRANTVRDYLINAGVNAARLSVKGYGEAHPIADNSTAEGKAVNRRVELRIPNR